ncbi:hypothetical protein IT575_09485 [bacterium]|nr:hypothetical protein [bacterium]
MSVLSKDNELSEAPRFELDSEGKVTHVTVALEDYLRMLVRLSILEPSQWPEEYRAGAVLLSRIREIERSVMSSNDGNFDFDHLSPETQDEYDGAIIDLNQLLFPGPAVPMELVLKELGLEHLLTVHSN